MVRDEGITLGTLLAHMQGMEQRLSGRIDGVDTRLSSMEKHMASLNWRVGSLEIKVDNLQIQVANIDDRLDRIEIAIISQKHEQRMTRLEQRFLKFAKMR